MEVQNDATNGSKTPVPKIDNEEIWKIVVDQVNSESSHFDLDLMKNHLGKHGSKIEVNGVMLYYEKVGHGPHPLLLCPGTTGTIISDYLPQMLPDGFDHEKYTIVSFEPRGYGLSCPPKRTSYPPNFQEDDAKDGVQLMKHLGYDKFSWIGWCAGGNVGAVAAALYPEKIKSLVLFGAYAVVTKGAYEFSKSVQIDLDQWSPQMLLPKLLQYDREYLQSLFDELFKYKIWAYEKNNGDCIGEYLPKVKCPVLVLEMKQDLLTDKKQVEVLLEKIPHAKHVAIEDGKHAFHLKYPHLFRAIVESFLEKV